MRQKKNIYFKSDFTVILASEAQWGGVPFRLKFYTASPSRSFVASFDGENYENCQLLSDGRLEIAINQKDGTVQNLMGIGTLMLEPEFYLDNRAFRDHVCNEFIKAFTPVFIDEDGTEYEVALDMQGSSTLVTIGTLPAFYQKGITDDEHDALIVATERAERAADNTEQAIANANEATRKADSARVTLTSTYNRLASQLSADYDAKKSALDADYADVKDGLSADYLAKKAQLDADYASEKAQLAKDYSAAVISLNTRMTAIEQLYSTDKAEWQRQVDAILAKCVSDFNTSEAERQQTFEDSEASRTAEFNRTQQEKQAIFDEKEATRDAANQAALDAAETLAEQGQKLSELEEKTPKAENAKDDADLDIADEEGNVIVRFENGHIKTKEFDSEDAGGARIKEDAHADLDISDEHGNVVMRVAGGHIKTKNFDSSSISLGGTHKNDCGLDVTTIFGKFNGKYVRIPCIESTFNGALVAICETRNNTGDFGANDIIMTRSDNYGASWSNPTELFKYSGDMYICPSMLRNGKDLYVFTAKVKSTWRVTNIGGVVWDVVYKKSTDDGKTWGSEVSIKSSINADGRFGTDIVCMLFGINHGIVTKDGQLVLNVDCQLTNGQTRSGFIYSSDNGSSWTLSALLPVSSFEGQVVQNESGAIVMNCRSSLSSNIGKRRVYKTSDMGASWQECEANGNITEPKQCEGALHRMDVGNIFKKIYFTLPDDSAIRQNYTLFETEDGEDGYKKDVVFFHGGSGQGGYTAMCSVGKRLFCIYERDSDSADCEILFVELTNYIL